MYARIENSAVVELWNVDELPPLHPAIAALYVAVPDGVTPEPGWIYDGETFTAPTADIETLRASVAAKIRGYALGLIGGRVPALSTFEMVELMVALWPALNDPASNANLAYCRDVYVFAKQRLTVTLPAATLEQLQAYVVEDDAWPIE